MVEITPMTDPSRKGFGFNVWITEGLKTITEKGVIEAAANAIANDAALQASLDTEVRKAIADFGPELTRIAIRVFLAEK